MNAIVIYMISELLDVVLTRTGVRMGLHDALFAPYLSAEAASFAYSLAYVLLMLAIAWFMYRREWFVRV